MTYTETHDLERMWHLFSLKGDAVAIGPEGFTSGRDSKDRVRVARSGRTTRYREIRLCSASTMTTTSSQQTLEQAYCAQAPLAIAAGSCSPTEWSITKRSASRQASSWRSIARVPAHGQGHVCAGRTPTASSCWRGGRLLGCRRTASRQSRSRHIGCV